MFLAKNQHTQRGKLLQTLICHYVDIVPSCQKLDIVIKNKAVQKLKVCPLKTVLLQSYPYMKKTHTIFLTTKVRFECQILYLSYSSAQNLRLFTKYYNFPGVYWFFAKHLYKLYRSLRNLTAYITLLWRRKKYLLICK